MVPLIEKNSALNLTDDEKSVFESRVLSWGVAEDIKGALQAHGEVDILLGCDLLNPIYGEESFVLLAKTISEIAWSDSTVVLLAYECRSRSQQEDAVSQHYFFL